MAKREVKSWITINGVHVPIFEGQTKEEAAKAAIARQKKKGPVSSDTRKNVKVSPSAKNNAQENTFQNRQSLKNEIDAYVKAHPNPNAEDRKKVSEMRDRYNAMLKESTAKTKAKVNAQLAEERKQEAKKKELEELKREHYKLYKHDEDNIPDRDEKLNALEKKISKLENGSGSTSDKKQRVSIYKNQLKDVQDDIKQFEDTPSRLRSVDYDQKLAGLKKKESDLQGYIDRDTKPTKSSAPEFKSRQEAEEYYKNKFAGVSSTYANKMAKKMGIEGRGKDKREALAKAYADRWETSNNINKDQDLKEKQISKNEMEKAFAQGQIAPEQMKGYGFTDKELEKIKKAGREEALQRVAEGKNTTRYIDPMGNINQTKTRSLYEKNYGEDFRDMSKPNARLEIAKMNDDGKTNHNIIEGKDITKLSDEEVHQLQVNQWKYKLTPLQKDALDKEMKSRGYYFEQGGWHKNSSGKTKVGETSGGTFNYKEMQAKLDRERAEKAAKEQELKEKAEKTFKPASDDIKRAAQAEVLKSLGINRNAAINEIRNRTGLSLEDAERRLGSMSADQIKKMLAGSQTTSNGVFGNILYKGHNRKLVEAVSKDLGISMDEAAKKMDTMYPPTIKKYIRMINRQKK